MTTYATIADAEAQHLRALDRANEVRLARAALKRRIQEGELTAAEVIRRPPDEADRWAIGELLACQRRWGAIRCRKFLARNEIPETKPVGQLTDRQRDLLVRALADAGQPARREMALV